MGNDPKLFANVASQSVVSVRNLFTSDMTLYSPLRSKRPGAGGVAGDREPIDRKTAATKNECDFCHFETMTALESFGRLETEHAVTGGCQSVPRAIRGVVLTLNTPHSLEHLQV